ncbi:MAG: hypothetical protein CME70_04675 [Halobacteriovorax sp.]|nr:hypothetical protein [Halobacteriovorax sp.]|tara:strand:+ start:72004 stop:72195 length:192 start_codon:yes stop_codon:yes gene_type:complete
MKNAIQINSAYFANGNKMIPVAKGILSVDTESSIDAFRKAAVAEEKAIENSKKDDISKTCKPK